MGIAWALSCVLCLLNYEEITRSGWVIPKGYAVIFWIAVLAGILIYLILLALTEGGAPTIQATTRDEAKNETAQTSTENEELVELPKSYLQLKSTHYEKTNI